MKTIHYDFDGVQTRIPHRFENLLLDHVDCIQTDTDTRGQFSITVSPGQSRGIFLQSRGTQQVLIRTALMEILALASVVCTDTPDDGVIIFASIGNFIIHDDFPAGVPWVGEVVKLKDKGNFVRCRGVIGTASNPNMASGELMAFIISKAQLAEQGSSPKLVDIPPTTELIAVDKTRFGKAPEMVVCDSVCAPYANGAVLGLYQYPTTHPLIKGHFPGNPIMMGIMQFLCVEDLCTAAFSHVGVAIGQRVSGNAQIIRTDGALIAEIKQFDVQIGSDQAVILGTKKVVFRESVRPGDTFFISLTDLTFE